MNSKASETTGSDFRIGDWADHKGGVLDPREVAEVDNEAGAIRLLLPGGYVTGWMRSRNYENIGRRDV